MHRTIFGKLRKIGAPAFWAAATGFALLFFPVAGNATTSTWTQSVVQINGNASGTASAGVSLNIIPGYDIPNPTQMMISSKSDFTVGSPTSTDYNNNPCGLTNCAPIWEPFNARKYWLVGVTPNSMAAVFVKLRDLAHETPVFSSDIYFAQPPTSSGPLSYLSSFTINGHVEFTASKTVTLSIVPGIDVYIPTDMMISNDPNFVGGDWERFSSQKTWTIAPQLNTALTPYPLAMVYVKLRNANYESVRMEQYISYVPTFPNILFINSSYNAAEPGSVPTISVTDPKVSLRIFRQAFINPARVIVSNDPNFSNQSVIQIASTTNQPDSVFGMRNIEFSWSLLPLAGPSPEVRTVYVKVQDSSGSTTPVFSTSVMLRPVVTPVSTVTTSTAITETRSPVGITLPPKLSYAPGELMAFSYRYKNDAFDSMTLNIRRELVYKNRTIKTVSASKLIKAGSTARIAVKEALAKNLKPGQYIMRIKMFDERGRLVGSNGVKFVVAPK